MKKQGYREGTSGRGKRSNVDDGDFDMAIDALKGSNWEMCLTDKEEKKLATTGAVPKKVTDKCSMALVALGLPFGII